MLQPQIRCRDLREGPHKERRSKEETTGRHHPWQVRRAVLLGGHLSAPQEETGQKQGVFQGLRKMDTWSGGQALDCASGGLAPLQAHTPDSGGLVRHASKDGQSKQLLMQQAIGILSTDSWRCSGPRVDQGESLQWNRTVAGRFEDATRLHRRRGLQVVQRRMAGRALICRMSGCRHRWS